MKKENGISAYKVRKDKWPDKLEAWAKQSNKDRLGYLSNGDYDNVMHQLLRASSGKSAKSRVMDPVGLSVMVTTGLDGRLNCLDYRSVTTKSNKHAKRMEPDEMTVVYPESSTGKAYRFVIEYNTESDEVTVMTQKEFNDMIDQLSDAERSRKNLRHWEGKDVWR